MSVNNFSPIQKTMQMQSYIDGQKSSLPLSVQPSSSDQEGCPKLRHWQQKGKKVQSIMWRLHNCLREKVEINVFEKYRYFKQRVVLLSIIPKKKKIIFEVNSAT